LPYNHAAARLFHASARDLSPGQFLILTKYDIEIGLGDYPGRRLMQARQPIAMALAVALAACATTPQGSTVPVMPAANKPFDAYANDQAACSQYAQQVVNGQAEQANNQAVGTAVVGTLLGAGLGAAIGSAGHAAGTGAAIGAASGAGIGTAVGAANSQNAQGRIQQQYDNAYTQCMYSRGNQVPGAPAQAAYQPTTPPPPVAGETPPPPPGAGYVWQPGYWQWTGAQYQWMAGRYALAPTATAVWYPDHWEQGSYGWVFVPGHWQG
jgi:WXXGXW repeat (2 copies)